MLNRTVDTVADSARFTGYGSPRQVAIGPRKCKFNREAEEDLVTTEAEGNSNTHVNLALDKHANRGGNGPT